GAVRNGLPVVPHAEGERAPVVVGHRQLRIQLNGPAKIAPSALWVVQADTKHAPADISVRAIRIAADRLVVVRDRLADRPPPEMSGSAVEVGARQARIEPQHLIPVADAPAEVPLALKGGGPGEIGIPQVRIERQGLAALGDGALEIPFLKVGAAAVG